MMISVRTTIQLWNNIPILWRNMMPLRPDLPIELFHLLRDDKNSWEVMLATGRDILLYLVPQILLTNLIVARVAYIYLAPLINDLPDYDSRPQRSLLLIPSVLVLVPVTVLYTLVVDAINNALLIFVELSQHTESLFLILIELITGYVPSLLVCFALMAVVVRFLCAPQVVILERCSPLKGFHRSWQLTRGSFWRVMVLVLAVSLWMALLVAIPLVVGEFLAHTAQLYGQDTLFTAALTLARGGSQILAVLVFPLPIIVSTLLYYDQRVRVEAFDIVVLA
jgi:hypothetical protein